MCCVVPAGRACAVACHGAASCSLALLGICDGRCWLPAPHSTSPAPPLSKAGTESARRIAARSADAAALARRRAPRGLWSLQGPMPVPPSSPCQAATACRRPSFLPRGRGRRLDVEACRRPAGGLAAGREGRLLAGGAAHLPMAAAVGEDGGEAAARWHGCAPDHPDRPHLTAC